MTSASSYMAAAAGLSAADLGWDAVDAMQSAFDLAWSTLCASGQRLSAQQACDARIRLARTILECVQDGERDPRLLRDLAYRRSRMRRRPGHGEHPSPYL